jgi:hypothetical protein
MKERGSEGIAPSFSTLALGGCECKLVQSNLLSPPSGWKSKLRGKIRPQVWGREKRKQPVGRPMGNGDP